MILSLYEISDAAIADCVSSSTPARALTDELRSDPDRPKTWIEKRFGPVEFLLAMEPDLELWFNGGWEVPETATDVFIRVFDAREVATLATAMSRITERWISQRYAGHGADWRVRRYTAEMVVSAFTEIRSFVCRAHEHGMGLVSSLEL